MGPKQLLLLQVKVDLGVMAMKGYFTFLIALVLESHHQIQFSVPRDLVVWFGLLGFMAYQPL